MLVFRVNGIPLPFDMFAEKKGLNLMVQCCSQKSSALLKYQGPVVQSVVSLTSLLRVISLTVLAYSIHNILIFFDEKM